MKNDLEQASLLYLGRLLSYDSFYTEELEDAYISLKDAIETKMKLEQRINKAIEYIDSMYFGNFFSELEPTKLADSKEGKELLSILKGE